MKRIFTFILALVSSFTIAGALIEANAMQISSSKENVYFNEYSSSMGRTINFDDNWRFYFGEMPGAELSSFDDSRWRNINLPHDYSIEQEFSRKNGNEGESGFLGGGIGWYRKTFRLDKDFDYRNSMVRIDFDGVYMNSDVYINGIKLGNHPYGYTPFSYDISKHLLRGDNTIAVRVNHQVPSSRWYSGSGIYRSVKLTIANKLHVDLFGSKLVAPNLKEDQSNVLLEVDTDIKNKYGATKSFNLEYTLYERDSNGGLGAKLGGYKTEAFQIGGNSEKKIHSSFNVSNPKLWSVDSPNLYIAETKVIEDGRVVDTYIEDFGFRYFEFDPNLGFSLNGERMKLKGVSMHHDQGSLGAVANKDAQERQIRLLKEMGTNAIRVTHNPASQTLIDAANEMGILLIEEAFDGWDKAKNGNSYDYARFFNKQIEASNEILGKEDGMPWSKFDLKMQIKRGSSDPSIIAWSLGNEIWEGVRTSHSDWPSIHRDLIAYLKTLDTSRVITTGDNKLKENNRNSITIGSQNAAAGGIVGFNYASGSKIDEYHRNYPTWPIYASETSSAINSRGVYHTSRKVKDDRMELTSYDNSTVGWGLVSSESWDIVQRRDYVAGEFIWTGFDYLGEPTDWNEPDPNPNGAWPAPKNSFFGILDTAGLPKDRYYFYQSQWRDDITTLHLLPAWDKKTLEVNEGDNVRVDVYSNAAEVRLYLTKPNGEKTLLETSTMREFKSNATVGGNQDGYYSYMARNDGRSHRDLYHTFNIPYYDGTLSVEAYNSDGSRITKTEGISERTTAKKEYQIKATVENEYKTIDASNKSLAYIRLDVVDSEGNIVSNATNLIKTEVSGAGEFVSMDNGWQKDLTKFSSSSRRAYNGSCIAIVRGSSNSGTIEVKFTSPGLKPASVKIEAEGKGTDMPVVPIGVNVNKNYFIRVNSELKLPDRVELLYSNGTSSLKPVTWTGNDKLNYQTPGIKVIKGEVEGQKFNIFVNVIDEIGGLISYSGYTEYGELPTLPKALEAYDMKGDKLGLSLDVVWDMPGKEAFEKYGIVKINGTASFLGQTIRTTSTISLREKEITTANIAPEAMNKTESRKNNDSFNAMFNNNIYTNGGYWTNFDAATKDNETESQIKLEYATKTKASSVEITFFRDTYSVVYPEEEGLVIEYLEGSEDNASVWTKVPYNVRARAEENKNGMPTKTYVYSFNKPIDLTLIRFTIKNHPRNHSNNFKMAVTGITELKLMGLTESTVIGKEAKLEALIINGYSLSQNELNKGSFDVSYSDATIEALGYMNAAVTIMPKKDNQVIINIVSEDNEREGKFIINFNKEAQLDPSFSGADYNNFTSIIAPKAQNQGNLSTKSINDNNNGSYYHSSWAPGDRLDLDKATANNALIFDLGRPMDISAIRYLPRQGENDINGDRNGRILGYEVWVLNNEDVFERVANGVWENNQSYKLAQFKSVRTSKVKLVAKSSFAANPSEANAYINCAEFKVVDTNRLRKADMKDATIEIEPAKDLNNLMLKVSYDGNELLRGHDYVAEFEALEGFKALVTIKGINSCGGEKAIEFELIPDLKITNIEILNDFSESYIGDIISISSLNIRVSYSNDRSFIINTSQLGNRIKAISGFDTALANGNNQLSLSVDGYRLDTNVFAIRGNLELALRDAISRYSIDLDIYKDTNKEAFIKELNRLKSLDSTKLRRGELINVISDVDNIFNKLELKNIASLKPMASLKLEYNSHTLTPNKVSLRIGARIDNKMLDKVNKEYGIIVLASNDAIRANMVSSINEAILNNLKNEGLAMAIDPEEVAGSNYHQFSWVINNIAKEQYGFEFRAFIYEFDKANKNDITVSMERVISIRIARDIYLANKLEMNLSDDIIKVLERI